MLVHDTETTFKTGQNRQKGCRGYANYGLDHWLTLPNIAAGTRLMLNSASGSCQQYSNLQTMLKKT